MAAGGHRRRDTPRNGLGTQRVGVRILPMFTARAMRSHIFIVQDAAWQGRVWVRRLRPPRPQRRRGRWPASGHAPRLLAAGRASSSERAGRLPGLPVIAVPMGGNVAGGRLAGGSLKRGLLPPSRVVAADGGTAAGGAWEGGWQPTGSTRPPRKEARMILAICGEPSTIGTGPLRQSLPGTLITCRQRRHS
jgi:hypothetical protein